MFFHQGVHLTKPKRAFDTEYGRFYAHPASGVPSNIMRPQNFDPDAPTSPKPSVTNIIGMMDEGFLPGYYAKLVSEYAVDNFGSIKYTADRFGRDVAVGQLKAVPSRPNPAAAIGDDVHDAIDKLHSEGIEDPEFQTPTARQMFARYVEFFKAHKPEIVRSEFTVWSYKYGYAGSGDLMWRLDDTLWVVDTKTGARVYPKVAMQNAAIAHGDVIIEDDGSESLMPIVKNLGVLHVRPRSCRLYEIQHAHEAFQAFLGLKAAFDWVRFEKPSTIPLLPVLQVPELEVEDGEE
jgi:hypothetical protein